MMTLMIAVTVFPMVVLGVFTPSNGNSATGFLLAAALVLIPGICVSLLQAFTLSSPSRQARVRWFGLSVISIIIGWCVTFVFWNALNRLALFPSVLSSDQLGLAALVMFIYGAYKGAIVGAVSGAIQSYVQHLPMRAWLIGNILSWGIGGGISLATFSILLLSISFTF